jgi:hypothetical protein
MKTLHRILVVLCFVVLAGYFLGNLLVSSELTDTNTVLQEDKDRTKEPVMIFEPANRKEWSDKFGGIEAVYRIIRDVQVQCDAVSGRNPLNPKTINMIVDIYGDNGNLTGHDGHTYQGRREISRYLYRLLRGGHQITDFNMSVSALYAKEMTHMIEMLKEKQDDSDFVHVIYFVFSGSFKLDGKLIDPPGSSTYGHSRICDDNNDL